MGCYGRFERLMAILLGSLSGGMQPSAPTIGTATAVDDVSATVAFTASSYIGKGTITYTATSVTIWLLQNLGYEGMLFMLGVWGIVTLIGVFWSLSKVVTKLRNTKTTSYSYSDEPQTVSEYLSLAVAVSVGGSAVGLLVVSVVKFTSKLTTSELFFAVYLLACTLGGIYGVCWVVYWLINRVIYRVVDLVVDLAKDSFMARLILPVLGSGISVGTGIIIGFNTFILLALTGTSLPALSMLLYPPLKRRKLIAKYRQSEKSLIKP
jgi:hypothetical protein